MGDFMGEEAAKFVSNLFKLADGSWITVQLDKPAYYAGETMTGKVIASIMSPQTCDSVVIKVMCKEKVKWDHEASHTVTEQHGDTTTTRTVWTHDERSGKDKVFKDVITVSRCQHVLPPGMHQYPFAYKIPEHVPGCAKFKRKEHAHDPAWRSAGHDLEAKAEVVFTLKAVLDAAGVFTRDLKSRQEVVVNPFFDWARMVPQRSSQQGNVMFLCCIPRGMVYLDAAFDKGAYAAGETAQISATIRNESKSNVKTMAVKLMRFVTIRDKLGHSKQFTDTVAMQRYEGVPALSNATRNMPLPLVTSKGKLNPSIKSKLLEISYRFDVECEIDWAPDIEAHLPVVIYEPAPAVYGLAAAFGGSVPAEAMQFMVPGSPMGAAVPPYSPGSPAGAMYSPAGGGATAPLMGH